MLVQENARTHMKTPTVLAALQTWKGESTTMMDKLSLRFQEVSSKIATVQARLNESREKAREYSKELVALRADVKSQEKKLELCQSSAQAHLDQFEKRAQQMRTDLFAMTYRSLDDAFTYSRNMASTSSVSAVSQNRVHQAFTTTN